MFNQNQSSVPAKRHTKLRSHRNPQPSARSTTFYSNIHMIRDSYSDNTNCITIEQYNRINKTSYSY